MNNTLTTIIEKSISGGYRDGITNWEYCTVCEDGFYSTEGGKETLVSKYFIICDPLFWQSLGKACGWPKLANQLDLDGGIDFRSGILLATTFYALKFHYLNLTTSFEEAVDWLGKVVEG